MMMTTFILLAITLLLKFFVHWLLIASHLLNPLSQQDSVEVLRTVLFYGFSITLVVIVLFFFSSPFTTSPSAQDIFERAIAQYQVNQVALRAEPVVAPSHDSPSLMKTITAVQRHSTKAVHEALSALTMGNVTQAKAMFQDIIQTKQPIIYEVAMAYQHLGALAFWDNTEEAMRAYQRAVELDPLNPLGWKQLGRLLLRIGQLDNAHQAFQHVLTLSAADDPYTAMAYGNLGVIELIRGNWQDAEGLFQQALHLDTANDDKHGMATNYGNLGNVYYFQGDLLAAEQMHQKALFLNQAIAHQKGVARDYNNLALIKAAEDDLEAAQRLHEQALTISLAIGHKEDIARDYLNLGVIYYSKAAFGKAIEMYAAALEHSRVVGDVHTSAMLYDNLGLVHYQQRDWTQAEAMFREAIALYFDLKLSDKVAQVCGRIPNAAATDSIAPLPACQAQPTLISML